VRDDSVPWVRDVWSLAQLGTEREQVVEVEHPVVGAPFGELERFTTGFEHVTDRAGVLDLIASRSYVIVLPEGERAALLAEVADLLEHHPALRGVDELRLPYRTWCVRTSL
jgi:hypothetical protein